MLTIKITRFWIDLGFYFYLQRCVLIYLKIYLVSLLLHNQVIANNTHKEILKFNDTPPNDNEKYLRPIS